MQTQLSKKFYPRAHIPWFGKERIYDEGDPVYDRLLAQYYKLLYECQKQLWCKNVERHIEGLKGFGHWVEILIRVLCSQLLEKSLRMGLDNLAEYIEITGAGIMHEALKIRELECGKLTRLNEDGTKNTKSERESIRRASRSLQKMGVLCIGPGMGSASVNLPSVYVFRAQISMSPRIKDELCLMAPLCDRFRNVCREIDPIGFGLIESSSKISSITQGKQHARTLAAKTKENEKEISKLEEKKSSLERKQFDMGLPSFERAIGRVLLDEGEAKARAFLGLLPDPLCGPSSNCIYKSKLREIVANLKSEKAEEVVANIEYCDNAILDKRLSNAQIDQDVHRHYAKMEPTLLSSTKKALAAPGRDISYPIELFKTRRTVWEIAEGHEERLRRLIKKKNDLEDKEREYGDPWDKVAKCYRRLTEAERRKRDAMRFQISEMEFDIEQQRRKIEGKPKEKRAKNMPTVNLFSLGKPQEMPSTDKTPEEGRCADVDPFGFQRFIASDQGSTSSQTLYALDPLGVLNKTHGQNIASLRSRGPLARPSQQRVDEAPLADIIPFPGTQTQSPTGAPVDKAKSTMFASSIFAMQEPPPYGWKAPESGPPPPKPAPPPVPLDRAPPTLTASKRQEMSKKGQPYLQRAEFEMCKNNNYELAIEICEQGLNEVGEYGLLRSVIKRAKQLIAQRDL